MTKIQGCVLSLKRPRISKARFVPRNSAWSIWVGGLERLGYGSPVWHQLLFPANDHLSLWGCDNDQLRFPAGNLWGQAFDIKAMPEKLIDDRPLVVAKCKIICATRLAIVEGKDSNGEDWRAEFSDVDITQHPYNLLREINNMLQSQHHRIVVTDIQWDAEPKAADKLVAPQLGNNQVLAPLTGYAVNSQGNLMIYASVVTNDETRRSLGANVRPGKVCVYLWRPEYQCPSGNNYIHCSSVGKGRYTSLQVKIPKLSKYFLCILCRLRHCRRSWRYRCVCSGILMDRPYRQRRSCIAAARRSRGSSLLDSWKDAVINAATSKNLITRSLSGVIVHMAGPSPRPQAMDCYVE